MDPKLDYTKLLADRKNRLRRFLSMDSPDIIIYHSMKLVIKAQRKVHGRWWNKQSLTNWLRSWWKYKVRMKHTMAKIDQEDQVNSGES